jgi:MHS family proline/betaine transporter-like MFS transporter
MLSDRWGHRRMMMLASGLFLLSVWPFFRLLQGGEPAVAQAVQIAFALMAGLLQGPLPALMAEMFPVRIRTTSMGIGYNLSVALLGGTAPAVATWLVETTGSPMAPALYIAFFAVVTIVALWRYRRELI